MTRCVTGILIGVGVVVITGGANLLITGTANGTERGFLQIAESVLTAPSNPGLPSAIISLLGSILAGWSTKLITSSQACVALSAALVFLMGLVLAGLDAGPDGGFPTGLGYILITAGILTGGALPGRRSRPKVDKT